MTTGNVQVRLGAGSLAPQTVTLVLPRWRQEEEVVTPV